MDLTIEIYFLQFVANIVVVNETDKMPWNENLEKKYGKQTFYLGVNFIFVSSFFTKYTKIILKKYSN